MTTHRSEQDAGRAANDSEDALCPEGGTPGLTPPDSGGAGEDHAQVGDGSRAVSIPQSALSSIRGLTAGDAAVLEAQAAKKRAELETMSDPVRRAQQQAEVAGIEALAVRLRDLPLCGVPELRLGRGGEMTLLPQSSLPLSMHDAALTVQAPSNTLAAEASLDRLTLARDAGALTLAVETAESVGADGAVQKMLAHEMATAHRLAMRLMGSADVELRRHERDRVMGDAPDALADAARSATAAARLVDSVARTALALDRLRHGSRQQVVVQHVSVRDGGQAVVAGSVAPGDGIGARSGGGSVK